MRKIKEILRLKWGLGLSARQVAASLRISHSTVGEYIKRAEQAGIMVSACTSIIAEWQKASYSNRLAASADMVVGYLDIYDFSDMDKIKQEATDLETCISTTASGGYVDNEQVSFIAALYAKSA